MTLNRFFSLSVLFLLGLTLSSIPGAANGNWTIHQVFSENRSRIVDAGNYVYAVNDQSLFRYDKAAAQLSGLNSRNSLSDTYVKNVYFDKSSGNTIIAYMNSNIDIIDARGIVRNLSSIKDMVYPGTKAINDVEFCGTKTYIATDFGYLVIAGGRIEDSHILKSKVMSIAEVGKHLILNDGTKVYSADKSAKISSLADFTATTITGSGIIMPIDTASFLFNNASRLYKVTISATGTFSSVQVSSAKVSDLQSASSGFLATVGASATTSTSLLYLNDTGAKSKEITLPAALKGCLFSSRESTGKLWTLCTKGVLSIDLANDGTISNATDTLLPNARTARTTSYLLYNPKTKKMMATNTGTNYFLVTYGNLGELSSFDGKKWENIAPAYASTIGRKPNNLINDPYVPQFDPDDSTTYIVGTWFDGAYKIKDKTVIAKYDWTNSPLTHALNGFYCNVSGIQFDRDKNLWLTQTGNTEHSIMVLPRDKQGKADLTTADWITPNFGELGNISTGKGLSFLITKKDNLKILCQAPYTNPLMIFDDGGNPASPSITTKSFLRLTDQEGKEFTWIFIFCFVEDHDGKVWMGTSSGIVAFDPKEAFSPDFRIYHPKDKTNPSLYSIDNLWAKSLAVDSYNRKWVGTSDNGVFLVSADGTEQLAHFTTQNSPINSDNIQSLAWDEATGSIFIGTIGGLFEYHPDVNKFESDYSHVSAYPALVTPDYTGLVTISGLKNGSAVNIVDASGSIIANLTAKGGVAAWDCHDTAGKSVPTGIYSVNATDSDDNSIHSDVARIHVVK